MDQPLYKPQLDKLEEIRKMLEVTSIDIESTQRELQQTLEQVKSFKHRQNQTIEESQEQLLPSSTTEECLNISELTIAEQKNEEVNPLTTVSSQ
ncbi:MAG: hypothetical protein K0S74_94 [Chlamydiales bacterium]|jgi:hypothetical protein|nr:hypothetical protein [Chlamydiales bacterium]